MTTSSCLRSQAPGALARRRGVSWRRPGLLAALFVAALALPACSKKAQPAAAPEAPAKAETAARGARAKGGEASRDALAMAPPGGKAAVDVTIEQHQKRLKV
ncbi:MAG: hypothetical protein MUF34_27450, partial [Polyangiaceae bacterium]|nr:hypothetical protein [Polyangiaceae bacterium]